MPVYRELVLFCEVFLNKHYRSKAYVLTALKAFSDNNVEVPTFFITRVLYLSAGYLLQFHFIRLTVNVPVKVKSKWG